MFTQQKNAFGHGIIVNNGNPPNSLQGPLGGGHIWINAGAIMVNSMCCGDIQGWSWLLELYPVSTFIYSHITPEHSVQCLQRDDRGVGVPVC